VVAARTWQVDTDERFRLTRVVGLVGLTDVGGSVVRRVGAGAKVFVFVYIGVGLSGGAFTRVFMGVSVGVSVRKSVRIAVVVFIPASIGLSVGMEVGVPHTGVRQASSSRMMASGTDRIVAASLARRKRAVKVGPCGTRGACGEGGGLRW
jgi:uncharacterized protein (UPF0254 family)